MDLNTEVKLLQLSVYCDIVGSLLKEHKTLSIIKVVVFSYLIKKETLLNEKLLSLNIKNDVSYKYLSLLAGDLGNLINDMNWILLAIDSLKKRNVLSVRESTIMYEGDGSHKFVVSENAFAKKSIEACQFLSDKQFLREVLSNV